jgi:hypothetical protein
MDIRKETLHLSLYSFFLYLANATMCIDEEAKDTVWNDMAYKLIEWNDVSRDELRAVFRAFGAKYEELCAGCNEPLPDGEEYEGNPLCAACKIVSGEYCPADCECTHCQRNRPCECGDCEVIGGTCDKQLEEYEKENEKPCICGTMAKDILCKMCEIKALETPMTQFLEVEEIMDKSYDGLYGYPTTAFLQNYGTIEGFRRISRSSHSLYGKYRIEKMTAYIESQKKV